MKNSLLTFVLMVFCSVSLLAINPATSGSTLKDRLNAGSDQIDTELSELATMNEAIIAQDLNFEALNEAFPSMVEEVNLSPAAAPGIFSGHPDVPVGIPGFWWGFCLGLIGTLIVFLVMDEGEGRKEQVRNSIYGCLIWSALWVTLSFLGALGGG